MPPDGYVLLVAVQPSMQETIARLRDQGAIISIPHPLDTMRNSAMGLRAVLTIIDDIDALAPEAERSGTPELQRH